MKKFLTVILSVLLIVGSQCVIAFGSEDVVIRVESERSEVQIGDTIDYTVYLYGADTVTDGIWSYEFKLSIPEGLTFVPGSGNVTAAALRGFNLPNFNEEAMKCTSGMGALGQGYTGEKIALLTFRCQVADTALDNLAVSVTNTVVGNVAAQREPHSAAGATVSLHVHQSTEPVFAWSEDHACRVTYRCTVEGCGEEVTREAVVTAETADASCTSAGKIVYTAQVEIDGQVYTDVRVAENAMRRHQYEAVFTWSDDCTHAGVKLTCKDCGAVVEVEDAVIVVRTIPAGESSEGALVYIAEVTVDGLRYSETKTLSLNAENPEKEDGLEEKDPAEPEDAGYGKLIVIGVVVLCVLSGILVAVKTKRGKKTKQ